MATRSILWLGLFSILLWLFATLISCNTVFTVRMTATIIDNDDTISKLDTPLLDTKELERYFEQFKVDFNRRYSSIKEELYRKWIFAKNLFFIFRHNRDYKLGQHTYTVGVNNFTDLTQKEFVQYFTGINAEAQLIQNQHRMYHVDDSITDLPEEVDWTTKGVVTPVKNQGACGSCWAFASVASIESAHAIATGNLVALSEQELVDCCTTSNGCNGGIIDGAFLCVIKMHGIDTEKSYPYAQYNGACRFNPRTIGATISSYVDLPPFNEDALQNAVATKGPVAVAIDASQPSFQLYKSGIYNEPLCSTVQLNHGVTVVGYGAQDDTAYWKVKNSWGTGWGENGYILMSRNKHNQCGIASQASYPVV